MLLITRRLNEEIRINDDIKIIYLGLNNWGDPKFGIDAPKNVRILREELLNKDKSTISVGKSVENQQTP